MSNLSAAQSTMLKTGLSPTVPLENPSLFILRHGWAPATTRQYAAAVNKFLAFLTDDNSLTRSQPFETRIIYKFILWCSVSSTKKVSANTVKRYLTGLRMWHVLHDNLFPLVNSDRIRLLLKSCEKTQVLHRGRQREGLTLGDVLELTDRLTSSNKLDLVTKAVILIGFWGLARLGELTLHRDHPLVFIRRRDLRFSSNGLHAYIQLRQAKTSQPGEIQVLRLTSQPNRLDPINVLHELLKSIPGSSDDPLFPGRLRTIPISRGYVSNFLKSNGPQDTRQWSGHSLRIGGASFQHHAGRSIPSLKRLGRWKSSVYRRYVRKYSPKLCRETLSLSKLLHF